MQKPVYHARGTDYHRADRAAGALYPGTDGGLLPPCLLYTSDTDDLEIFAREQYAVRDALCLWSDVPELLEGALRAYQGRAFYDGTAELEPEFLARMSEKYGLILL